METTSEPKKTNFKPLILGVVGGLAIAFFIFLISNFSLNSNKTTSPTQKKTLQITLTTPTDYLATSEKSITVTGNTGIKSIVTVSSSKQSKIVETSGNYFSASLDMVEGRNIVTIVAFDPVTNDSQTATREVLYLNQDLTNL